MTRYRDSESEKVVEGFAGMNPAIAIGIAVGVALIFAVLIYMGSME